MIECKWIPVHARCENDMWTLWRGDTCRAYLGPSLYMAQAIYVREAAWVAAFDGSTISPRDVKVNNSIPFTPEEQAELDAHAYCPRRAAMMRANGRTEPVESVKAGLREAMTQPFTGTRPLVMVDADFSPESIATLKELWARHVHGNEKIEIDTEAIRKWRTAPSSEDVTGSCPWCFRDYLATGPRGLLQISQGAPLVTFDGKRICAACQHVLDDSTPCPVRGCAHAMEPRWTLARGTVQGCPVHGPGAAEEEP